MTLKHPIFAPRQAAPKLPRRGPLGALRTMLLLGAALLGVTACGVLPYSGPPDQSTGESEHGPGG